MATIVFGDEIRDPVGFEAGPHSVFVYAYVCSPEEGHPGLVLLPDGRHEVVGEDWGRWAKTWEGAFRAVRDLRARSHETQKVFDYVLVPRGYEVQVPQSTEPGVAFLRVAYEGETVGRVEVTDAGTGRAVLGDGGRQVALEGVGVNALLTILYALHRPEVFDRE